MPDWPGTVEIAGTPVARVGLSLAALRATGMWGEPRDRSAAVRTIARAVAMGLDLVEVPVPFGPWADLLRQAAPDPARLVLALRLTGTDPGRDLEVAGRRLGPGLAARAAVVLAGPDRLEATRAAGAGSPAKVGLWLPDPAAEWPPGAVAAVRGGPSGTAAAALGRCAAEGIPYLGTGAGVLAAGEQTVVLLEPSGPAELERLYEEAVTPPAAGPG